MDDPILSNEEIEDELQIAAPAEDDYEEIDSDEVDRVVSALEALGNSTESENIRHLIEEASNQIYYLVYSEEDEDEEGEDGELLEEAA